MKKIIALFVFIACSLLLSACNQQTKLCNQIQEAVSAENLDDLRITAYFMDLNVEYLIPPTLEQLTSPDNENVTVYHLEGQEAYDSIQVIQNQLCPEMIEPLEATDSLREDARVYYVLENKKGEKLLELLVGGMNPSCVFLNGIPVAYNAVFHDIIQPCIGFQGEDLWWYFGDVIERPIYENKPNEYPNSVWVCDDPKITMNIKEDGAIDCLFDEPSDNLVSDTLPGRFEYLNNEFYISNFAWIPSEDDPYSDYIHEVFVCRCDFSLEKMTAVVTNDELFDGKYTGQQIIFVRKDG